MFIIEAKQRVREGDLEVENVQGLDIGIQLVRGSQCRVVHGVVWVEF